MPEARWLPIVALLTLLLAPALADLPRHALAAQSLPASAPLPPSHWAHDALERLGDAGLLHGVWSPGVRPVPRAHAGAALDSAAARAARASSPLAAFARAAAGRYRESWDGAAAPPVWVSGSVSAVGDSERGPGALAAARVEVAAHPRVALMLAPAAGYDGAGWGVELPTASLAAHAGPLRLEASRTGWRYGLGRSGLLLDDAVSHDALGVRTIGPRRLPGPLGLLGPVDAAATFTRVQAVTPDTSGGGSLFPDSVAGDPWLIAARIGVAPHPRLRLGATRIITTVTRYGGEGLGGRELAYMAIGKHTAFDDQKAAIDASLRLSPLGFPVVAYGEFGFEDSAGAISEDPGFVAGAHLPRLPGLPTAGLRYEYTAFGREACPGGDCGREHRSWFLHPLSNRAHAAPDGRPLGHALGGYGREHRVQAVVWLAEARLRLTGTAAARRRRPDNLLYTVRGEREGAIALRAEWRPRPQWHLDLRASAIRSSLRDRDRLDLTVRYLGAARERRR